MLERVTVNALGEGALEFNPDGLVWTCIIRPEHLFEGDDARRAAVAAPRRPQRPASAGPRRSTRRLALRRVTPGCRRSSSRSRGPRRA